MRIYVNSQYVIRNEKGCSYIVAKSSFANERLGNLTSSVCIVPPMVGYILSHISDAELKLAEEKIAETTFLKVDTIDQFVNKLIDNPSTVGWKYKGVTVSFPPYLLTYTKGVDTAEIYTDSDFSCSDIFIPKRPSKPLSLNLVITTQCYTDCIYCYADRNRKDDLSVQNILKILDEAYDMGVVNLTMSGGDLFAFSGWKRVIQKVCEYNFFPLLSTKVPLKREDIFFLRNIGAKSLQVSLDSVSPDVLTKMVHVGNDYIERISRMLGYCDEAGIKVGVRTVLTKYNVNKVEIEYLYSFMESFSCVTSWVLTPAFLSEFKDDFVEYRASDEDLIQVYKQTQLKSISSRFKILYNKMSDKKYNLHPFSTVESFVENNQICNANSYTMAVLSNGDATACEMLYGNSYFLFGNVRNQSLYELWNSSKALEMYSYKQEMIKHNKNNQCTNCSVYSDCKLSLGKRVCYVDITKVYGRDKYEYPDPRCPNALACQETLIL